MQTLEDGDLALLDMGAEYNFYGSDITCSYPVSMHSFVCNSVNLGLRFSKPWTEW